MTDDEVDAFRAEVEQMDEEADFDGHPKRWQRGRAWVEGTTLRLEANSRERVTAFLRFLSEIGCEYTVTRQVFFEPQSDIRIRRGAAMPCQPMTAEALDNWVAQWPELPMPGLQGQRAIHALGRAGNRPVVEAALREFEHDVAARAQAGLPVPDIDEVRRLLDMPVGAWLTPADIAITALRAGPEIVFDQLHLRSARSGGV